MPTEPQRKPRKKPGPYGPQEKIKQKEEAATSATTATQRRNLTLQDWMMVFSFVDLHPGIDQCTVVKHFATKTEGALIFNQSTLSRKLQTRSQLEERVHSNPNALSFKRPRIVTHPDVEKALVLWFQNIENKGETVTGPMFQAKRQMFEEKLNVPKEEHMLGDGWIASFCRVYGLLSVCYIWHNYLTFYLVCRYKIKKRKRHGKAGTVDPAAAEAERVRVCEILAAFLPQDHWNFDESSLFAFAPPNRGLSSKQMKGKKKDKF